MADNLGVYQEILKGKLEKDSLQDFGNEERLECGSSRLQSSMFILGLDAPDVLDVHDEVVLE